MITSDTFENVIFERSEGKNWHGGHFSRASATIFINHRKGPRQKIRRMDIVQFFSRDWTEKNGEVSHYEGCDVLVGRKENCPFFSKCEDQGRLVAAITVGDLIQQFFSSDKFLTSLKRRIKYTVNKIEEFKERVRTGIHVYRYREWIPTADGNKHIQGEMKERCTKISPARIKWCQTYIGTLQQRLKVFHQLLALMES